MHFSEVTDTLGGMNLQEIGGKSDRPGPANLFYNSLPLTLPGINRRRFLRLTGVGALVSVAGFADGSSAEEHGPGLFKAPNLVAWCIVPFDAKKRGPEERARMLKDLGFTQLAYDWREEHIKTFDAELEALQRQGIDPIRVEFPCKFGRILPSINIRDLGSRESYHIKQFVVTVKRVEIVKISTGCADNNDILFHCHLSFWG